MAKNFLVTQQGAPVNNAGETLGKGTPLTHAELDNNFFAIYVAAEGTAQASKALILDANGDLNMNNVGRIDNCETVQFNSEISIGAAGAGPQNITLDSGQKQTVTLDAATVTLNLVEPTSVGNWLLRLNNTAAAAYTITWTTSGAANVYWAGGSEPIWTESGEDIVSIYYNGSDFYMAGTLNFS